MKRLLVLCLTLLLLFTLVGCRPFGEEQADAKPVIYLYPEEETEVTVKVHYAGTLTTTWPAYEDGWTVRAMPDGTLYTEDGSEYSYLFWEGVSHTDYDFTEGFVVAGEDTGAFLKETLAAMGMTAREYNEFIVYWLPQMEGNTYNLISFQGEAYTENAGLEITPTPDSVLRVFMAWKGLEERMEIEPQTIEPFTREGFAVGEWGGREVK